MSLGGWAIGEKLYEWIMHNFPDGIKILELGSGSGSSMLGKTHDMHCVEHDSDWLDKYDSITYYHAPIVDGWYDEKVLEEVPSDHSLLLIDGPPGYIGRSGVLPHIKKLAEGKIVIVDDTHRKAESDLVEDIVASLGRVNTKEIKDGNKSFVIIY